MMRQYELVERVLAYDAQADEVLVQGDDGHAHAVVRRARIHE